MKRALDLIVALPQLGPELFNVIRDDLSLVGPRPLLVDYLKLYTPKRARPHEVKPA